MDKFLEILSDARQSLAVPEDAAKAYSSASRTMADFVDQSFLQRDDLVQLSGGAPFQILQEHHQHHAAFMSIVFEFNNMELLCRTMPWFYRTYSSRGLQQDYFLLTLEFWKQAVQEYMEFSLASPILKIYSWIEKHHQDWIQLSDTTSLSFQHTSLPGEDVLVLVQKLLAADSRECIRFALQHLARSNDISRLYLNLIQPALYEIGRKWERGEISTAQEHMATAIVSRIMASAYGKMALPDSVCGFAVVVCARNEFHEIGARMVADLLERDGWDVSFMGAETSEDDLISHLLDQRPNLLGISVSMVFNLKYVRSLITRIREHSELDSMRILVGGPGTAGGTSVWKSTGADGWAVNAADAVSLARQWQEGNG